MEKGYYKVDYYSYVSKEGDKSGKGHSLRRSTDGLVRNAELRAEHESNRLNLSTNSGVSTHYFLIIIL